MNIFLAVLFDIKCKTINSSDFLFVHVDVLVHRYPVFLLILYHFYHLHSRIISESQALLSLSLPSLLSHFQLPRAPDAERRHRRRQGPATDSEATRSGLTRR